MAVILGALVGCAEANVDEADESLFSLRGSVIGSAVALSNQLVSALTFTPFMAEFGHTDFVVMGDHEGRLLEDFELKIYEPPPKEALITLTQGEPAVALGGIAIVSPAHPSRLDWERDSQGIMQVCDETGECGEPQENPCGTLHSASCLGTLIPGKNWGLHGIAGSYMVLYLDETARAGGVYSQFFAEGREIPQGYNLIHFNSVLSSLSNDAQNAYFSCQTRAQTTALTIFNDAHETDYKTHTAITQAVRERSDARMLSDWDGAMIEAFVREGCVLPGAQELSVDHGKDAPLDLFVVAWQAQ
jgi:hypothetical protein